jgi:hypothetical protein
VLSDVSWSPELTTVTTVPELSNGADRTKPPITTGDETVLVAARSLEVTRNIRLVVDRPAPTSAS